MPSPSENKAIDLILEAFPGSELITDTTKKMDIPVRETVINDGWGDTEQVKKPKPPSRRRGPRPPKNMDGMF